MSTTTPGTKHTLSAEALDLQVIRLVGPPRATQTAARLLLALMLVTLASLIFLPWQQNARGTGRVIAYAPVERQQTIDAPLDGRVVRWHVQEGDHVNAGDVIVDIVDNDPEILARLQQERVALESRVVAAQARLASVAGRVDSLGTSRDAAVKAAEGRVFMARDRVKAAERALEAATQAKETARLNQERQQALFADGLASRRAVELAELELTKMRTDEDRANAMLSAARTEEAAIASDRAKVASDGLATIHDATATRAAAEAEIASAQAEMARIDVRVARQSAQSVKAPREGTVLRVVAKPGAEMVKTGEPLAVIVPDTQERAVELWVTGNDVPLVTPGRVTRLQFEGWPAVQFTGWPQVAVGTFAGRVAFVDAADDGTGRFRVVVVPVEGERWPATRFLRQGTRCSGWILLERVRLGYELWRQFNGFPPLLPTKEMYDDAPVAKAKEKVP